ncbi:DUF4369 domain-containing protein [Aureibaculum sp. 2210JD6-5]|uniref:DUF4369 domain-containing protein n=1 Tax=Aureibaculum sp. 2210JD6-5 TaxID=3103957 RepID=UPI002ABDE54D|nr:DUF4369 domain-containing protein [Aureibaculum sp. 2210JD6-5]
MSFFSCDEDFNKKNDNSFYIFGKVDNIEDSTKIYLKVQESNKIIPLDTTYAIDGTFQFMGKINKPEVYGIYIDSIKSSVGLFIQNDSVFIDINRDKLSDSKIKGSELNDQYLSFIKKSNEILSKINYLFPLFQKARTENDVDKLNEINKKIEAIHKENTTFVLNFARENPDSYIAAFALQTLLKNKYTSKDTIASIYNNFTHNVKKGDFAIEILLYLENQESLENIEN